MDYRPNLRAKTNIQKETQKVLNSDILIVQKEMSYQRMNSTFIKIGEVLLLEDSLINEKISYGWETTFAKTLIGQKKYVYRIYKQHFNSIINKPIFKQGKRF